VRREAVIPDSRNSIVASPEELKFLDSASQHLHHSKMDACPSVYSDLYTLGDATLEQYVSLCRVPPVDDSGVGVGSGNIMGSGADVISDSNSGMADVEGKQSGATVSSPRQNAKEVVVAEVKQESAQNKTMKQIVQPISQITMDSGSGKTQSPTTTPIQIPANLAPDVYTVVSTTNSQNLTTNTYTSTAVAPPGRWILDRVEDPRLTSMEAQRHWSDPLVSPLPYAPSMTIYNLYGIAKITERRYFYRVNPDPSERAFVPFVVDKRAHAPEKGISHGVGYSDGDGTVPLLSLGYMCGEGGAWSYPALNPAGIECVTREYLNKPVSGGEAVRDLLRTGGTSGDHVDIIGNSMFISDLAAIAGRVNLDKFRNKILVERNRIVLERKKLTDTCDASPYTERRDFFSPVCSVHEWSTAELDLHEHRPAKRLTERIVDWLHPSKQATAAIMLQRLAALLGLKEENMKGITMAEIMHAGAWPFEELPDEHGLVELQTRKHSCIDEISKRIKLPLKAGLKLEEAKARKRELLKLRREEVPQLPWF